MNQKGSVNIVLIIVILALAVAIAYLVFAKNPAQVVSQTPTTNQTETHSQSPSSNATAGLTTYRDDVHGFEFEYPDIFHFDSNQNPGLTYTPKAFVRLQDITDITTIDVALITKEQSKLPHGMSTSEEIKVLKNPNTNENMYFSLTTMVRLQGQEAPSQLYTIDMQDAFKALVDSLRLIQ